MTPLSTRLRTATLIAAAAVAVSRALDPAVAVEPFVGVAAAPTEILRSATGQADLNQIAENHQVASVSGSSVSGTSTTGAVTIDGNAFQNLSGLSVLNANTGNNVAISAAMNVNISITPGR